MIRSNHLTALLVAGARLLLLARHPTFAGELMSPGTAARLGLEEAWRRQLSVPAGADSIVDQQVIAHRDVPREYVEVVGEAAEGQEPTVYFRIATDQAGPDGQSIGKEEAERLARREVRFLRRRVKDAKVQSRTVPQVRLYTASNNGTLECRDAETGVPIWMAQVGNPRLVYGKMGINDKVVSITNGPNLIKLDAETGGLIRKVRMSSTPLYGAIHAGDYSVVPIIRGGVEGYSLKDFTADPFLKIVSGIALNPPTKSTTSSKIAWATDRELVYVMELSGEPSLLFQLTTDGIVSGRIAAASGDRFVFGSEAGQVYGVRATRSGEVMFNRPFGEPFYESPFLFGGKVLLPSTYGNLFALDEQTGEPVWQNPVPSVDRIVGAFDGRAFVQLLSGAFAAVDLESGKIGDADRSLRPSRLLTNRVTDRLYLVNSLGTVQCLSPIGSELPRVRELTDPGQPEQEQQELEKSEQEKPKTDPSGPFDSADPFGGDADDPFGDGGDPMEDPFGTPAGDDPFGDPF